ncbi:hypothetical protein N9Y67_03830 [Pseudomonadota bacterium]|nr:hypothetical protein [Pseudomonadota bacterium]
MKKLSLSIALALSTLSVSGMSLAVTMDELAAKLDALAQENAELRKRLDQVEGHKQAIDTQVAEYKAQVKTAVKPSKVIGFDKQYGYDMLDSTTRINSKQRLLLERKKSGDLAADTVTFSGAVTAIADYQKSNTESKFGYLMRHPTSSNQRTREVSEAVIHSAQLAVTANLGDWMTAYIELLYDPEQSFGAGTLTDLNRNQVQVRRGYVLLGNLEASPYYASLGKMAVPFGLTDTVNPFTASTVWHAFGGLAYGLNGGYSQDGLNFNVMAVQGGAQFRGGNVPVDGSSVPSKLNNYAVDLNYTFDAMFNTNLLVGASYIKGSSYCQEFPITHFNSCQEENGAYDIYTRLSGSNWQLKAEIAQTEDKWPGTFNPTIPQFGASKVTSWDIGGQYNTTLLGMPTDYSLEFSRFDAGPSGSPWEKQDQWVLGIASYITPSAKLFGEYVHTEGYAPLNFLSGGNLGAGATHSDADAQSDILMMGANIAF